MSIEQQPPKSNKIDVNDMPSLDRTVIPPKEHRDDKDEKKLGWKKPAAAVALLGAVAAGAFGGMKAMGGDEKVDTPRSEPTVSAPANPGEKTEGEPQTNPTEGAFELDVENFKDGEQLVRGLVEQMNGWHMGGATPETVENIDRSATLDEYVESVATPIDEAYIEAMVVKNWQNDESLRGFVEAMKDEHRIFLKTYIGSSLDWSNKDNPYTYYESVDSYEEESVTPDRIVASYRYVAHDNFAEVSNADKFITESQEGETGGSTVTWTKEGNVWKIADVEYNAQ